MAEGYGKTVWCSNGLQTGRYVSGQTALALSLFRRFSTAPGTLQGGEEESNFGFDLSEYVGEVGVEVAVLALPAIVKAQAERDDRVLVASARVFLSTAPDGVSVVVIELEITPADEGDTFPLTLQASAVTTSILGGLPS